MNRRIVIFVAILAVVLAAVPVTLSAYAASPIVLVSATTNPSDISPGDSFDLKLKVKNSGGSRAENLIVTLDVANASVSEASAASQEQKNAPAQAPISVVGESNVRYLGSISAGAEKEATFRMVADGAARSGTYNLNVKLDYGSARAQNQIIGVVLVKKPDLRITQVTFPGVTERGREFKVAADIVNGGNFSINGVSAELSGEGAKVKSPNYFIGALEASDSDTYETTVKFPEPGEKTLTLKVNYIDDFNHAQSITKSLNIKVEGNTGPSSHEKKSDGFFSRIINFIKAIFGLGGNQE